MIYKKIIACLAIGSFLFVSGIALSQNIKLNPIKPGTSAAQPLTDEQQGILAVRTIKASVVNILGAPKPQPASNNSFLVVTPVGSVAGTGFIIDSAGLIVTNNHVVDYTNYDFTVILADGTQYPATVMGKDKFDDIALLKISAQNLPAAKLGDSDSLETGQSVFAIGNSLGKYQNTVTKGVISGLGRSVDETNNDSLPTMHNWIQTDAAINLGNSGGPLINLAGEVVGMDTLIDSSGSSLGFAVPVNTVKDSANQLKTFGQVSRPFMGIQFVTLDAQVQADKHLNVSNGALIVNVSSGGPAQTAGLQAGDIVIGLDNFTLSQQNELDVLIQKYQAGNQVLLKVLRGGQEMDLPVILGSIK